MFSNLFDQTSEVKVFSECDFLCHCAHITEWHGLGK